MELQKYRKLNDKEIISNFMYIPKFSINDSIYSKFFYSLLKTLS